jgi:hypothetical protein
MLCHDAWFTDSRESPSHLLILLYLMVWSGGKGGIAQWPNPVRDPHCLHHSGRFASYLPLTCNPECIFFSFSQTVWLNFKAPISKRRKWISRKKNHSIFQCWQDYFYLCWKRIPTIMSSLTLSRQVHCLLHSLHETNILVSCALWSDFTDRSILSTIAPVTAQ